MLPSFIIICCKHDNWGKAPPKMKGMNTWQRPLAAGYWPFVSSHASWVALSWCTAPRWSWSEMARKLLAVIRFRPRGAWGIFLWIMDVRCRFAQSVQRKAKRDMKKTCFHNDKVARKLAVKWCLVPRGDCGQLEWWRHVVWGEKGRTLVEVPNLRSCVWELTENQRFLRKARSAKRYDYQTPTINGDLDTRGNRLKDGG